MSLLKKEPLLGCIADDYTGATDLSSMLARAGLRVVQFFDVPKNHRVVESLPRIEADAVVVAVRTRSAAADEAIAQSLAALELLQSFGIERFFFKYCSTFDSTPQGNIGPVADALAQALQVEDLLFCPAYPENGRTVYLAHSFVGDKLLNESSLRDHPLHPMTDSNLVRVLQAQSQRPVDRLLRDADLPEQSGKHWIVDAIEEQDLRRWAHKCRGQRLLTGASAVARYWAEELFGSTGYQPVGARTQRDAGQSENNLELQETTSWEPRPRIAILAGSCSKATREQVARFAELHPVVELPVDSDDPEFNAQQAMAWFQQQWSEAEPSTPLLAASGADPKKVVGLRQRLGIQEAAELVERTFAALAALLLSQGVQTLVVAGGETSGAVVAGLGVEAVRIGHEIAPGVPWIYPLDRPGLGMVLKSGNFGDRDFFLKVSKVEIHERA